MYTKNKIQTACVRKKGSSNFYVIWVKMSFLQKRLAHQNLCHVAMKKVISYCKTKHPTKEQVKKNKRKMSKWNYDNKSVYVRKDLAYKWICYINLGVIEPNEFRKNLGAKRDQSIRMKRSIIAIIMKILVK